MGTAGLFVPIAGLILYLLWKDERPRTAKAAGIGALVSTIVSVVVSILFTSLYMGLMIAMMSY